jgi:diamine N-acetyltransferase
MKVTMNKEIEYIYGGMELFSDTVPLRLKLLEHHSQMSQHFASYYSPARIDGTKQFLTECNARGSLHIGLARHIPTARDVGFCISTVSADNVGEIFAIWVEDDFKNMGLGAALSETALAWLRSMKPKHLEIHILFENAKVRSFYERLGFFPQTILLREVKTTVDNTPGGNDRESNHGVHDSLSSSAS